MEALDILKQSPPLLLLTLRRKADGNQTLLLQQEDNKHARVKLDTASFLTSVKNSSQNSKESELVIINPTENSTRRSVRKNRLSVDTFDKTDVGNNISRITSTPPILKRSNSRTIRTLSGSMPSLNTNATVESRTESSIDCRSAMDFQIDLHKEPGKGLGIAVTGGPKHVITDGIKVLYMLFINLADTPLYFLPK